MELMQKLTNRKVNLDKVELIYATIYLLAGKILDTFVGKGITLLSMGVLMFIFTILLIVFFRQHLYAQDKPLLTALSIYYKSAAYVTIIFIIGNFAGQNVISIVALASLVIYGALSYVYGRKYNELLNAYLYMILIVFGKFFLV